MAKDLDLQKKSEKELLETLESKRKALWDFRFGVSGSKERNVKEGMQLRRDIARILTEVSGRRSDTPKS